MSDNRTTELREKLTERGVEYTTNDHLGAYETSWDGFTAMQLTPGAKLMMVFTPDQAIAATLGSEFNHDGLPVGLTISDDSNLLNWRGENYVRQSALCGGNLTAEQVRTTVEKHWHDLPAEYDMPEATALPEYSYDWQAIADELNATLGGGECKWVWVESWTDTTDGRECDYAHWMPDCGCWSEDDYRFSDFDDYEEKPTGIVFCERCGKVVKR